MGDINSKFEIRDWRIVNESGDERNIFRCDDVPAGSYEVAEASYGVKVVAYGV